MRSFPVSFGLACLVLGSCALSACDTATLPDGALSFVTATGDDPWSGPPAVDNVQVDFVQGTARTSLGDVTAPFDQVSLGNAGPTTGVAHFEATGLSSAGDALVFGSSIPFTLTTTGFAGAYIPLFVGRKGNFAPAPSALLFPRVHPLSVVASNSDLLVVSGDDTSLDFYDASTWSALSGAPALPQTSKSVAVASSSLLLINDTQATWLDLTSWGTLAATLPAGLANFAEISGGQTLVASDGTIYIVGATRTDGAATNKVLLIDTAGTLHTLLLNTARLGAAATLVEDTLIVAAGSTDGAGVEQLALGATTFSELSFPGDDTTGAGLAELTSASVLLAGGHDASGAAAPTRTIDLGCAKKCSATELPKASLSVSRTSAFRLADNLALVVGETDDHETHAYLFDGRALNDKPTLNEQALRTPRSQASSALLPNGQVAVFGGTDLASGNPALSLDVFFP